MPHFKQRCVWLVLFTSSGFAYRFFNLLPDYFSALAQHWQDILWGASVPAIAFVLWELLGQPPKLVVVVFVVLVMFIAGYHTWRADHLRLMAGFKVEQFATLQTPMMVDGRGNGFSTYVQLVPKCLNESNIEECRGILTAVQGFDKFSNAWKFLEEEAHYLEWSNSGYNPITLYSRAERRLNVFFIHSSDREYRPCVFPYPLRFQQIFNNLSLQGIIAVRFDIKISAKDCSPVAVSMTVTPTNDPYQPIVELEQIAESVSRQR